MGYIMGLYKNRTRVVLLYLMEIEIGFVLVMFLKVGFVMKFYDDYDVLWKIDLGFIDDIFE